MFLCLHMVVQCCLFLAPGDTVRLAAETRRQEDIERRDWEEGRAQKKGFDPQPIGRSAVATADLGSSVFKQIYSAKFTTLKTLNCLCISFDMDICQCSSGR